MVATTFLTGNEPTDVHEHPDIEALIQEVSERTNQDWLLTYKDVPTLGWRRWLIPTYRRYQLYAHVGGVAPYQAIGCISTLNDARCYLLGILTGLDKR